MVSNLSDQRFLIYSLITTMLLVLNLVFILFVANGSSSRSILQYVCKSAPFKLKLQAVGPKIELLYWYLSKILIIRSAWYSVEQLFWRISIFRNSSLELFCKKGVPQIFTKFAGKQMCQSLFLNKAAALTLQLY